MRKPPSDFEVYNDLDGDVVNVFRVLRDRERAGVLRELLRLTPWARAEFEHSYDSTDDLIERARRTIVRCFMAHGSSSRRRKRSGFRAASHPSRAGGGFGDWRGYHDALPSFTDRLLGVVVEEKPALAIIERHDAVDCLFYVDPPYPMDTRSSMRGQGDWDRAYAHEMTDDDHRRLASVLHRCVAAVIISGYPCGLYDHELYAGWRREERPSRADGGRARTEVVWIKAAGITLPAPYSLTQSELDIAHA